MPETSPHTELEYDEITPEIIIGTNACCLVHFDSRLLAKGVRADISLEEERMDTPNGVSMYLWLPTKDKTAPEQHKLHIGTAALRHMVEAKIKTYVHCKNGHGRAPTLVAAYFITTGMSADDAIEFVKSKRNGAHLEESQVEALREFEKSKIR